MRIEQKRWVAGKDWVPSLSGAVAQDVQLVFVFGSSDSLKQEELLDDIRKAYPNALLMGCSTAGEILAASVYDDTVVLTAVYFEHTRVEVASLAVSAVENSLEIGTELAKKISHDQLVHAFVLSDGLGINGTDLVKGLISGLPQNVTVTGGLAGDGVRFKETLVFANGVPSRNMVTILGLYGDKLKIGYGSLGGWDPFGPERIVTSSKGNILYALDGKPALELYKKYLGEHAQGLPATGLLFPLSMRVEGDAVPVVRTILSVDEAGGSMTFAGTMPQGAIVRLMKVNLDRLIEGACGAARTSQLALGGGVAELALLISCVGRKLILKQRVEEEVEGVRDVLGESIVMTGFYSYGEISPFTKGEKCALHNQTMTITTVSES